MNCAIVNAFIIYTAATQRAHSKKRYTHLDYRYELAHQLVAGFSGRKRREPQPTNAHNDDENLAGHESVHMNTKRRCRVHMNRKEKKETVFGCKVCSVHLCKDVCHNIYYNGQ